MTLVNFDEAMIHLMQCSLVISRCNITFSVFWLSQGSVATVIRWGGWRSYHHMWRSFVSLTAKSVLKSVDFSRSYRKNKLAPFLWPMVYNSLQCFFAHACSVRTTRLHGPLTRPVFTGGQKHRWRKRSPKNKKNVKKRKKRDKNKNVCKRCIKNVSSNFPPNRQT